MVRSFLISGAIVCLLVAMAALAQDPASDRDTDREASTRGQAGSGFEGRPSISRSDDRMAATDRADARGDGGNDGRGLTGFSRPGRQPVARVRTGISQLPNEDGQIWREYDITPYVQRLANTAKPQQAIVDWILRETGYEAWHSEPLAILSANDRVLRAYHTPEMHAAVGEIVDRFVTDAHGGTAVQLRVVSVMNPNWRAKVGVTMRPLPTETPGTQAWLMAKEDAAFLQAELRKRMDFREYSAPQLLVGSGQSTTVTSTRPRSYIRNIVQTGTAWPGFDNDVGELAEGFVMDLAPLASLDGRTIDVVLKCEIDQVEKLVPVAVDVLTPAQARQRAKIEVPQVVQARFHERFRWPSDQVLVVGLGLVPAPVPDEGPALFSSLPFGADATRCDLLVFVETKDYLSPPSPPGQPGQNPATAPQSAVRIQRNGRY